MSETNFADGDLRETRGLDAIVHRGPSILDGRALARSRGDIPESFLRGCGFSDWEIESAKLHNPVLTSEQVIDITYEIVRIQAESPIQLNPIFISYAHKDSAFIETLEKLLNKKRLRYWRDIHGLTVGRVEKQIEQAIHHNPTFLLVLSKNSVKSDWVEWEAAKARELEKALGRDILCPVALDTAWKSCSWPGPLRRQIEDYYVLDFSAWKQPKAMGRQFERLIKGLRINYPKANHGQP